MSRKTTSPHPALPFALLAAVGLWFGLWGIDWGLPSRMRADRIISSSLQTPEFNEKLMRSWQEMHQRLGPNLMLNPDAWTNFRGVERIAAGWKEPPSALYNSIRSFYTRTTHDDEQTMFVVLSRMKPWRLQLHPHFFTYGGAYIYTLGAWEAIGAALGRVPLHGSLLPYLNEPVKMARLYEWGRLFSVLSYIGCAWLLLLIGRRWLSEEAGLLGGLLFLLSPGVIIQAHTMKPNTFWSLLALCALYRSLVVLEKGGARNYAWAGAASGATMGAFLGGWPACLVVGAAAALRVWLGRGSPRRELSGLSIAAAASVAAFFATNPFWLLDFHEAIAEMRIESGVSSFNLLHPFLFYWGPVRRSVGELVFFPMLAAMGAAAWRGRKNPALLLCIFASLLAFGFLATVKGVEGTRQVRYFIGWLAVALLLLGEGACTLLKGRLRLPVIFASALILMRLSLAAALYSYNFELASGERAAQFECGRWLEAHVAAGDSVGMLRMPGPSNGPYFRYDRYDMTLVEPKLFSGLKPSELPRYLLVTIPDFDDRPSMEPNLSRYERVAGCYRPRFGRWQAIEKTSTTANAEVEVYRLR